MNGHTTTWLSWRPLIEASLKRDREFLEWLRQRIDDEWPVADPDEEC